MGKNGGIGAKRITHDVLEKLCEALKCNITDILE